MLLLDSLYTVGVHNLLIYIHIYSCLLLKFHNQFRKL